MVKTINARDLHQFLKVETKFNDWIQRRINEYGFVESQDFVSFTQKRVKPTGGRPSAEYHITLDMAKELCMVEKNEQGRIIRRYFIECEKRAEKMNSHIEAIRSLLLLDSPSTWEKLYPDSFFIAMMNLHGHCFNGNKSTPSYCAKIIRRWIYDIVLPDQLNFEIDTKRGEERKHQWFAHDNGRQTLLSQIDRVEMIARMSESRVDFESKCARAFLGAPLQLNVSVC